jgi:uncharacterized membrane protein (UPF0127 family)
VKRIRVINKTRDSVLGSQVEIVDRWWSRVRGFLGRPEPDHGVGLLLSPCRAVHMIGVGFPLDVLFVNREGVVVATYPELKPGSRTRYHIRAEYALEMRAGTIRASGTKENDVLAWLPAEEGAGASAANGRAMDAAKNGNRSGRRAVAEVQGR